LPAPAPRRVSHPARRSQFPIPLAFSPAIHNLCLYEGRNGGLVLNVENKPAEGRLCVILFSEAAENANYEYYGTWAVTAP
jgi:hypothetical protein